VRATECGSGCGSGGGTERGDEDLGGGGSGGALGRDGTRLPRETVIAVSSGGGGGGAGGREGGREGRGGREVGEGRDDCGDTVTAAIERTEGRTEGGTLRRGDKAGRGGSGGAERRGGAGGGRELGRPVNGVYNCSASEGVACGGGRLSGVAARSSLALMRRGGPLDGPAGPSEVLEGGGVGAVRLDRSDGAGGCGAGGGGAGVGRIATTGVTGASHGATPAMAGTAGARGTESRTESRCAGEDADGGSGGGAVERDELGGRDIGGATERGARGATDGGACDGERVGAGW
jgi:hypothetical protein